MQLVHHRSDFKWNMQRVNQIRRHPVLFVLAGISLTVIAAYLPAITAYFISDDFSYLSYLVFNAAQLLNGQKWDIWFLAGIDGYLYFRPFGHALMLVDFLIGNQNAVPYHLTNVILHILVSFEIYLLGCLLTRRRMESVIAALLFGLMPIHSGAVSWIAARYDVLSGLWCLASLIFFILYRQKGSLHFYGISLGAFALGLASKETALVLAPGIMLYDLLFAPSWRKNLPTTILRHMPFWLLAGGRLLFFGRGYQDYQASSVSLWRWVDGILSNLIHPLSLDMTVEFRWLVIAVLGLLLAAYRFRKETLYSLLWIPLTSLVTLASGPSGRSFYIPSIGLAMVLATVLATFSSHRLALFKFGGVAAFFLLSMWYGSNLLEQNQDVHLAGEVAEAIPIQVKSLHPTLPKNARLVFIGVPNQTSQGTLIYLTGFPGVLPIWYASISPEFYRSDKFPIWFDRLEQTYFFQVDHRKITERADLIQALQARDSCGDYKVQDVSWNFSNDLGGWEAQNQLTDLEIRDGTLVTRSLGNDPYMASSLIDIPSLSIGEIEIEMRVHSTQNQFKGELYWLATGQADFFPGLNKEFLVQSDDQFHVYRIDIAKTGRLNIGDHIQQLRLDPTDGPAEIYIKSIRIFIHCYAFEGLRCVCTPGQTKR